MNIEYTHKPTACELDFLTQKINQETSEYGEAIPFAFFIKDDDSNIIAGANGFVIYGAVHTDQLWTDKNYRYQGLARKIMSKIHELGKSQGCKIATVQTMNFQSAQAFYEKLGYVPDFKRGEYTNGGNCIFMRKTL